MMQNHRILAVEHEVLEYYVDDIKGKRYKRINKV